MGSLSKGAKSTGASNKDLTGKHRPREKQPTVPWKPPPKPLAKQIAKGSQGLRQLGNTCFLASCVQSINTLPALKTCIRQCQDTAGGGNTDEITFFSELCILLDNLKLTSTNDACLSNIRHNRWAVIQWPLGRQACALQCLGQMFECLSTYSPTCAVTLRSEIVYISACDKQQTSRISRPEAFLIYTFTLPPYTNDETGLATLFDTINADENMECICDKTNTTNMGTYVPHQMIRTQRFLKDSLPTVFVVAFNRFVTQSIPAFSVTKNGIRIHIAEKLVYLNDCGNIYGTMDTIAEGEPTPVDRPFYELSAVIYHSSTVPIINAAQYSGHYFVIAKGGHGLHYKFNDSIVSCVGNDFNEAYNTGPSYLDTPHLLFYTKGTVGTSTSQNSQTPSSSSSNRVPLDNLGAKAKSKGQEVGMGLRPTASPTVRTGSETRQGPGATEVRPMIKRPKTY